MKNIILFTLFTLFVCSSFTNNQNKLLVNELHVKITSKNPSSNTSKNGELSLRVTGGEAPYNIAIFSTFLPAKILNTDHFELNKLGVGSYTITVQDNKNEIFQQKIILTAE